MATIAKFSNWEINMKTLKAAGTNVNNADDNHGPGGEGEHTVDWNYFVLKNVCENARKP